MGRFGVLVALLAGVAPALPAQASSATIAILPFADGGSYGQDKESFEALGAAIPAMLQSALTSGGNSLVPRSAVRALLPASGGWLDAAQAATIGRRADARYVITGAFMDHYGRFRIDARIVDVERGAVTAVVSNDPALRDRRQLFEMIQSVAGGIARELGTRAPAAPTHLIPTDAITLYGRGLLSADRGNADNAARFLRQAIQADPRFPEAREALRGLGSP